MIEIIGTELNQWDIGRSVKVTDASHVHFANQGDSRAVIMELADSQALIPNYLLQTGKQLCVYAVANGVTIERKTFSVKKRERPENYVYDEDHRNYIYELITEAEEAIDTANQTTQDLLAAKERGDFNGPKGDPFVIINQAKGNEIVLGNAEKHTLIDMHIFGKTTQNGVPTPEAPVEIVSVGDSGSITVGVSGANEVQSLTLATPNGLPGIPVSSGGNYTDADGQQWICDEIDLARGVYVKRIGNYTFTGNEVSSIYGAVNANGYGRMQILCDGSPSAFRDIAIGVPSFCAKYISDSAVNIGSLINGGGSVYKFGYLTDRQMVFSTQCKTIESFKAEISGATILYQLATPIETPLSEEELATYAALHTYRGRTTVSNDAGAWMELEYVMDAKKYLDSLVTGGIAPATIE